MRGLALIAILICTSVMARELTLAETEELLLSNNRELQAARRAVESADAQKLIAGARPNATFSVNSSALGSNSKPDTVFRIDQPFERGNKRDLRLDAAAGLQRAAYSDSLDVQRQQLALARGAYFDLKLAQERAQVLAETAQLFSGTLDAAQRRLRAGDLAPADVAKVQVDYERSQNDARAARADVARAQLALGYLVGLEAEALQLRAADSWPAPERADAAALEQAIGARPDVIAARYGLNVADVQDVIESALGGKAVTQVWEGEQRFAVAVRLDEEERQLTRMQDLLIATPSGAYVPLSEVASFRTVGGLMNIARENGKRVFAIGVFIRGRDMGGVVGDMQANVAAHVKLPEGTSVTWSGEFENQERAMARLAIIVPISILIIFLLLFDAFKSFASALVITANIPFSVIGGILALWITGIYLSVSAAIGFIALFGQAVLNGVVMVTLFNQLRSQGASLASAVSEGAMTRLRTVMMTALLASLGLLPMALSTGIGAETQKPLAVVVIGGLVSATLLVLFVLPVLYVVVSRRFGELSEGGTETAAAEN
jgi:hypothetical protein